MTRTSEVLAQKGIEAAMQSRIDAISSELSAYEELLAERDRLREALQHLRSDARAPSTAKSTSPGHAKTPKPSKPRARRPRGANRAAVLDHLAQQPGSAAGDVASATKIQPNVVYNLLRKLVLDGEVDRVGADGERATYRLAE